jgi:tetraacyldisaccharide 4'-kinase
MGTPIGHWLPDPGRLWYGPSHPLSAALLPLSWLYCAVALGRRLAYQRGWLAAVRLPVPVIVVGNISVGGTGKTPLVLWLVQWLQARGHRPGIMTRGYGGSARDWPRRVTADSDPAELGDESVLLARRAGCPVVAGPDRIADGRMLVGDLGCDILVSDDGLQHYRLRRDLEIAVLDGRRGLGNGRCLPSGPLREPPGRLAQVDLVVSTGADVEGWTRVGAAPSPRQQPAATSPSISRLSGDSPGGRRAEGGAPTGLAEGPGFSMDLVPRDAVNLADPGRTRSLREFRGENMTAVAGIGNPGRFFALLRSAGLEPCERAYPDHHPYTAADAATWGQGPVLMTEKDAVKCAGFARPGHWYLPVEARPEAAFVASLEQRLEGLIRGQQTAGHPGLPPV